MTRNINEKDKSKMNAQNHCNVGNGQLVLDEICSWIERAKTT